MDSLYLILQYLCVSRSISKSLPIPNISNESLSPVPVARCILFPPLAGGVGVEGSIDAVVEEPAVVQRRPETGIRATTRAHTRTQTHTNQHYATHTHAHCVQAPALLTSDY